MVKKVTVVHLHKQPYNVYIGRPSIFGNPFELGRDGTREEVIEKYRKYAIERYNKDEEFALAINSLKGKVLGCWCKPRPCHGEVLAEMINENQ